MGGTAIWLAYETKGLLIGEAANRDVVAKIRSLAQQRESIEQVNEVLTMHMGPDFILVNLSVNFRDSITAGDLETEIATLDRAIKEADPRVKRVFVEAEAGRDRAAAPSPESEGRRALPGVPVRLAVSPGSSGAGSRSKGETLQNLRIAADGVFFFLHVDVDDFG